MITELFLDELQIMDLDTPFSESNYYVNKFAGIGSPPPRSNRITRARRHGAHELTTYYDPRTITFDVWVQGIDGDWADFWTAFDALKEQLSLTTGIFPLIFKRAGSVYYGPDFQPASGDSWSDVPVPMSEFAEVLMTGDAVPRWPNPNVPLCVFEGVTLVAHDPRLWGTELVSINWDGSGGMAYNLGNFASPPLLRLNLSGGTGFIAITNSSLSIENHIRTNNVGTSGVVEIDCRARTVKKDGVLSPDLIYMDYPSFFWSLASGENFLNVSGISSGTVDVEFYHASI